MPSGFEQKQTESDLRMSQGVTKRHKVSQFSAGKNVSLVTQDLQAVTKNRLEPLTIVLFRPFLHQFLISLVVSFVPLIDDNALVIPGVVQFCELVQFCE